MKKLVLAVLALSTFTACKNDDDSTNEASIVGTWKISKWENRDGVTNTVLLTASPNDCMKKGYTEFGNDNLYSRLEYFYNTSGVCDHTSSSSNYTYNTSTKLLTIGSLDYEVLKLTENELQISIQVSDDNGDGVAEKFLTYYYR